MQAGRSRQDVVFACRSDRRRSGPTASTQSDRGPGQGPRGLLALRQRAAENADDGGGDMRPALPMAHLARRDAAEILKAQRAQNQGQAPPAPTAMAMRSARKDGGVIMESLELQRIAAEDPGKRKLPVRPAAFKPDARLDDEGNFLFRQPRRQVSSIRVMERIAPKWRTGT